MVSQENNLKTLGNRKILAFSGLILLLAYIIFDATRLGDFKVSLEAADLLKGHHTIYNVWLRNGECLYYYSPFFALILIPFTYLPHFVPNFIFLCADVYFIFRIWKFFAARIDFSILNKKEVKIFFIAAALLTIRFLLYNFDYIQMTIFLIWAVMESWTLFQKKKNITGALLLALAINIKILPIVFIPYLIYRGKFIPALFTLGFSGVFLFLPALFTGVDFNNLLLAEWWKTINPLSQGNLVEPGSGYHSLTSLIPSLFMVTEGDFPFKRNVMNLDIKTVMLILNLSRLFFILLTLYFTGPSIFKKAKSKIHEFWEISYIMIVIPLIFPHQQKYAFFMILPAVLYIVYFLILQRKGNYAKFSKSKWAFTLSLLVISFILSTLTTDLLIGVRGSNITQFYKTITYGTFLLIIILALCNPKYINVNSVE